MICGECLLVKGDPNAGLAFLAHCESWHCEECIHRRRKRLTAEILSGRPTIWFTLTVNPNIYPDPEEAARELSRALTNIAARAPTEARRPIAKRKQPSGDPPVNGWKRNDRGEVERQVRLMGSKLHFYAVMEATERGYPHFHVFARAHFISADWLSARLLEEIGAFIVDVERLQSHRKAAVYAAKYTGKGPHRFGSCKRYRRSQGWRVVERKRRQHEVIIEGRWQRESGTLPQWIAYKRWARWTVRMLDARTAYAERPP